MLTDFVTNGVFLALLASSYANVFSYNIFVSRSFYSIYFSTRCFVCMRKLRKAFVTKIPTQPSTYMHTHYPCIHIYSICLVLHIHFILCTFTSIFNIVALCNHAYVRHIDLFVCFFLLSFAHTAYCSMLIRLLE